MATIYSNIEITDKTLEITIKKNIDFLMSSMSEENIIKGLFEQVVESSPRRCTINSDNEILIKNFRITNRHKKWTHSKYWIIGNYRWRSISEAKFRIEMVEKILVFKFKINRLLLVGILMIILFSLLAGYFEYSFSSETSYGLKISLIVFLVCLVSMFLEIMVVYLIHLSFIKRFIKDIEKK